MSIITETDYTGIEARMMQAYRMEYPAAARAAQMKVDADLTYAMARAAQNKAKADARNRKDDDIVRRV